MYYTGKGDDGLSTLFGTKERLPKDDAVFVLLGSLDELNCWLGMCKAYCTNLGGRGCELICLPLETAQEQLFIIQAQVAGADKVLSGTAVTDLENTINRIAEQIDKPNSFLLPGACMLSAFLDTARTVARRCEQVFLNTSRQREISGAEVIGAYLNRLSSLLYILVRLANQQNNVPEKAPSYSS